MCIIKSYSDRDSFLDYTILQKYLRYFVYLGTRKCPHFGVHKDSKISKRVSIMIGKNRGSVF